MTTGRRRANALWPGADMEFVLPRSSTVAENRDDAFRAARFFPALQQIRTVSVLWVIASHMQDPFGASLNGPLGVVAFFAVSGFLITTLLLREESRDGSVSLRGFYIRRSFRILPLYFLVLAAFTVLIMGLHLGGEVDVFVGNLPYYLTYQNDFAAAAPLGHSWSLAIEEKFYLLWPLLGFGAVAAFRRQRGALLSVLLVAAVAAQPVVSYLSVYVPILAGCLVAVVMHDPRGFAVAQRLAHPAVVVALLAGAAAAGWWWEFEDFRTHTPFALLFAAALPGLVLAGGWFRRAVEVPLLVWAGARTYAVYLIHPLVKSAVDEVIPAGQAAFALQCLRFALVAVISFGAAEVLLRWFEAPMIRFGRRFASKAGGAPARLTAAAP